MYSPLLMSTQTSIKVNEKQVHKLRAEYSLVYNTSENSSFGLISLAVLILSHKTTRTSAGFGALQYALRSSHYLLS